MNRKFSFVIKRTFFSLFQKNISNLIHKPFVYRMPLLLNIHRRSFSTDHKIDEKHSLEYIEAGVFEVLKSAAKCKQDKLLRTATLDEVGFDSLDVVELIVALEERFDLNLSGKNKITLDDDSMKVQSVLDMIQIFHSYYVKKLGTTQPAVNDPNKAPENL